MEIAQKLARPDGGWLGWVGLGHVYHIVCHQIRMI